MEIRAAAEPGTGAGSAFSQSISTKTRFTFLLLTLVLIAGLTGCDKRDASAPMANKNGTGQPIAEDEVKKYITSYWTRDCQSFEECKVTFDSAVRINPLERHSFPNGITVNCYPVKVDFTTFRRNKSIDDKGLTGHHRGGVHYFYRNSFDDWEMQVEGVDVTRE